MICSPGAPPAEKRTHPVKLRPKSTIRRPRSGLRIDLGWSVSQTLIGGISSVSSRGPATVTALFQRPGRMAMRAS
jgi:hypothetical protein